VLRLPSRTRTELIRKVCFCCGRTTCNKGRIACWNFPTSFQKTSVLSTKISIKWAYTELLIGIRMLLNLRRGFLLGGQGLSSFWLQEFLVRWWCIFLTINDNKRLKIWHKESSLPIIDKTDIGFLISLFVPVYKLPPYVVAVILFAAFVNLLLLMISC